MEMAIITTMSIRVDAKCINQANIFSVATVLFIATTSKDA